MAKQKIKVIREEMLQVAKSVAQEKNLDSEEIFSAMEQALEKAARVKYGQDIDIRVVIDRDTGDIKLKSFMEVVDEISEEFQSRQILIFDYLRNRGIHGCFHNAPLVTNRIKPVFHSLWNCILFCRLGR